MKNNETGAKAAASTTTNKATVTESTKAVTEKTTPTVEMAKAAETAKAESKPAAETATPTVKTETIEELQKRLEIELKRLNRKKELAKHRETFMKSIESLQLYIDELKNEDEFETQSAKLTFNILSTDKYDRINFTDMFSISNTALINKFCDMLLSEMKEKVASLETEFLTA